MNSKKTICVDFDGVIHSYQSGWMGMHVIPDGPVPGALVFLLTLAQAGFVVCIFSSHNRTWRGRSAMRRWLFRWYMELGRAGESLEGWTAMPKEFKDWIGETAFADPYEDELKYAIRRLIAEFRFPVKKPAAHLTIDDRAWCFKGEFPEIEEIRKFTPWNKKMSNKIYLKYDYSTLGYSTEYESGKAFSNRCNEAMDSLQYSYNNRMRERVREATEKLQKWMMITEESLIIETLAKSNREALVRLRDLSAAAIESTATNAP